MTDHEEIAVRASRATMQDVADAAGVSLKSVSRVINKEPHVTPRLRTKVEAAIAALNYVPDTAARSLAGQRHFTLGLLLDNPSPHYTMELVSGAYRACRENRYTLQFDDIANEAPGKDLARRITDLLKSSRLDGIILTPPVCEYKDVLDVLEQHNMPFVRIAPVTALDRAPAVLMDDRRAAAEIADHLWALGHRRFGFVRGHPAHASAALRRDGFVERVHEYNPDAIVIEVDGDYTFEGGLKAGKELFAARRPPTAIFAANDDTAAGLLIAASQLGFKVPGDVSVAGFDDSWIAKSVWPYLTTIRQPIADMGYMAARLLIDRNQKAPFTPKRVDYEMIVRDSVGDAP